MNLTFFRFFNLGSNLIKPHKLPQTGEMFDLHKKGRV